MDEASNEIEQVIKYVLIQSPFKLKSNICKTDTEKNLEHVPI